MKGILICGGTGTRLRPLTEITNKSLLPVYDKPLVLYPLQTLLDGGIRDIVVISSNEHIDQMASFLGSGERFGCKFTYRVQDRPGGIAQALGMAEEFAGGDPVCAILGDNVFFDDLSSAIRSFQSGGHVFLKEVPDPERFGVAEVAISDERSAISKRGNSLSSQSSKLPTSPSLRQDYSRQARLRGASKAQSSLCVTSIEEKPPSPRSNLAVTGCYLYDGRCFDMIKDLQPSTRGELEITDLSKCYLEEGNLTATILENEWIDAGTFESLHSAAVLVRERAMQVNL